MSTSDQHMMDIDELTVAMGNTEVNPQGPTGELNRLAELLADSRLSDAKTGARGEEVFFPPGTTDDEQLLILAGAQDWHLDRSSPEYPAVELPPTPPEFGPLPPSPTTASSASVLPYSDRSVQAHMGHHLISLAETEHWAKIREAVKAKYAWFLDMAYDGLHDAELPDNPHELAELCNWMADEVYKKHVMLGKKPVFAPADHVFYPCWVAEHPSNEVIQKAKLELEEMQRRRYERLDDLMRARR
ncbi:hypothetical protein BU26DRAFT_510642 [Trematosphaeria pertusa]|uniref:Uncharacterized protein n=1 Tax=Trematosphaeria pertusa TaxID=390896 RepID=A0A6A6HXX5_9PLEO|nr:uncharacterized protein BU26DRAFT_510642 [Trematosphaeria pertusa]KAF2242220.1 hypothetical protein BU26DRAFT_510642 [Trematosphaeria pertusa]